MESFDLVIVGAGIHGLVALKTYIDVHPNASILVIDKGSSLGGVWAVDRLYPGLHTNNHFRTFEYSDYPMKTDGFNLENDHIPGEHVYQYLCNYAQQFNLTKYIRLNTSVELAVDRGSLGWTLTVADRTLAMPSATVIKTSKLTVATGLTSEPFMPKMVGRDEFQAPVYHTSEFAKAENGLGTFKKVVLLGGAKFSWDIACAYASAGVQVDWVIRESGHGPCWMTPPRLTPFKIIPELLLQTRLITWLSPCIWEDGFSYIRNFFSKHWLGRMVADKFFTKMQHNIEESNRYHEHPETAKLHPWDDVFFIGTNRGLLNYDVDFFEYVRNGTIRVHIANIERLSYHTVHLSDGKSVAAEVLICGTGWKDTPQIEFKTERELGLPGHLPLNAEPYIAGADCEILEKCPKLQHQPPRRNIKAMSEDADETTPEPYRLYRFMVPPAFVDSRSLVFAGAYRSGATIMVAQSQALWMTAFFDNNIPGLECRTNVSSDRVMYETVLHTQFGKWRYSKGFGARFPELWFECLPYVDLLLKDIGVANQRKKSWWAERLTPYVPKDYQGIVDEYMALRSQPSIAIHSFNPRKHD